MKDKIIQYQEDLKNPNVQIIKELILETEGTGRYSDPTLVMFGGEIAPDHGSMFKRKKYVDKAGKELITTASGWPQVTESTVYELSKDFNFDPEKVKKDFNPKIQDLFFIKILDKEGALDDIKNGNFEEAVKKINKRWPSLPGSNLNQPAISWEKFNKIIDSKKKITIDSNDYISNIIDDNVLIDKDVGINKAFASAVYTTRQSNNNSYNILVDSLDNKTIEPVKNWVKNVIIESNLIE